MKILIIGSGGREHAIGYKIKQSSEHHKLYFAPGNAGTSALGINISIAENQIEALLAFGQQEGIELTIVGPEMPLQLGIVDIFQQAGMKIFGPHKQAALLETSKSYAKKFMERYQIPTAKYQVFDQLEDALGGLALFSLPVVIKADGLAAGKGVFICQTREEAAATLQQLMETQILGDAGSTVVLEEYLEGKELSLLCFTDGRTIVPMESASDYKKAYDQDQGPNTGGMGCISPSPQAHGLPEFNIVKKTFMGMQEDHILYKGIVYIGLMITSDGPKVLEYNVRFGDPETEVLLLRLESDLVEVLMEIMEEKLETQSLQWKKEMAICVVLASEGYPEHPVVGKPITNVPENTEDFVLFHAATKSVGKAVISCGGRVVVGAALGKDNTTVRNIVYEKMQQIQLEGSFYRRDIGIYG